MFIATLFTIAKIWTQSKCPSIDEWVKKMYMLMYMYISGRIPLSHNKEWNLAICDSMDEPGEYYAKWNKSDRGQMSYICDKFTYKWNLKANQISIIETHIHVSPCSLQHHPQQSGHGGNLNVHQQRNEWRHGTCTQWILLSRRKRMKYCHLLQHGWT